MEDERIFYDPPTAIIPEDMVGVFSTEVVIFYGENEVTIDFIQGIVKPFRLVSRIILNYEVAKKFFEDLKKQILSIEENKEFNHLVKNLVEEYSNSNKQEPQKVDDVYDDLKLTNEQLRGFYSNKILITYGKDAFCLDFINNIYPKSIVVSRIFMSFSRSFELLMALKKITQI
jgi:polyhydroxyalkanoate synthesis regulator phasin